MKYTEHQIEPRIKGIWDVNSNHKKEVEIELLWEKRGDGNWELFNSYHIIKRSIKWFLL